jgi:hypothetical protein
MPNKPAESPDMTKPNEFDRLAAAQNQTVIVEFWHFLMQNKKWWLTPILLLLLLLSALIVLGGTGAAPLIYTLF